VRVALVHPFSWPAVRRGGERYLHDLAGWLSAAGHDVDVLTGDHEDVVGGGTDAGRIVTLPVRTPARLASRGATALDTFGLSVLPTLARERYDVVHSLIPSGAVAAAITVTPSVYTALGHPSPSNPPVRRWSRELFAAAVRLARVPAALSESAAAGVEGLTGVHPHVLPPGVHTDRFEPNLDARTGPPRLLFNAFAGDPRKRLRVLLQAMPLLLAELPDARLVLGGGGDAAAELDALDTGVRRDVENVIDDLGVGTLDDVPGRYRDATVSVLPSVDEAFGLVLVESLACGTPVVCSRSGGMPEIVTGDDVGRVVAPDDAAALARGVVEAVQLAADPATPARCRAAALPWDWCVVGRQHELVYSKARA
jgi:phosphatidyl-myo-inositol alpha-mannosyltransferase